MPKEGGGDQDEVTTAYVLGELGNDETTQLETRIKDNSKLKTEVDELRELSELISRELRVGERLGLTEHQRRSILEAARRRAQPAPVRVLVPVPVRAPGLELIERLELLLIYLGLVSVDLVLPRAPAIVHGARLRARRWVRGDPDYEFAETPTRFGLPDSLSPNYLKLILVTAFAAVLLYAWLRVKRYPKQPMPVAAFFVTAGLQIGLLLLLLQL